MTWRRLLVGLNHCMGSDWVKAELRYARLSELRESRQKLFHPAASLDRIRDWRCFDTGKDLAVEPRTFPPGHH